MPINENQAKLITYKLFNNLESDKIDKRGALEALGISERTYTNYSYIIRKFGYVNSISSQRDGRKADGFVLTEKGATFIHSGEVPVARKKGRMSQQKKAEIATMTLDEITKITDDFNEQSRQWRWILTRKDENTVKRYN